MEGCGFYDYGCISCKYISLINSVLHTLDNNSLVDLYHTSNYFTIGVYILDLRESGNRWDKIELLKKVIKPESTIF
jgi:hypothetical protein